MHRTLWLVLALVLTLSGCTLNDVSFMDTTPQIISKDQPTSATSVSESPLPTVVQQAVQSPLPTPTPEPLSVSQPARGKGSIVGTVAWINDDDSLVPADVATLYLAPVIESEEGLQTLVSLNKDRDPMTVSDEFGRFAFMDIEPGTYGLIFSIPGLGEALINEHGNEGDFLIIVEEDKITDLGQIAADFPFQSQ